jgi:uncharacterized protein (TIGR02145 family)
MKQIKVKPIRVEPIHVSPVLVTSTRVESIYVSGESGETVNTRPRWVEIGRVLNTQYCQTNNQNENTGILVTWYTVTYEDQNENSSTYGNTKTSNVEVDTYDTTACPLPEPEPSPYDGVYPNALVDYDGNYYDAVIIGDQVWLGSNLRTTHTQDGTLISFGQYDNFSNIDATQSLCYYPNGQIDNVERDGLLYSWSAASILGQNVSSNWCLPTQNQYIQMKNYLSTYKVYWADGIHSEYIAKSIASSVGWKESNVMCAIGNDQSTNNITGFNATPAGQAAINSLYGQRAHFWTATGFGSDGAISITLYYDGRSIETSSSYVKKGGFSVRLIYNGTVEQFLASYRDLTIPDRGLYPNAVQDYDGNYYDAVIIGDQVWLAQNLYTRHYVDGSNLYGHDPAYGTSQTNGLVYSYDPQIINKSIINLWKIPSYAEVQTLVTYVTANYKQGSSSAIAKALSAEGDWMFSGTAYSPGDVYSGEYNTTGFSARPNMGDSEGNWMLIRYWYGALQISCSSPDVWHPGLSQGDPYGIRLMYDGTVSEFLANYVDLNPSNS